MLQLIVVALALATVLTISHALLRAASSRPSFEVGWLLYIGGAIALYGAVFFAYSFLLKYFDVSILYPTYTGLSVLGVFLMGVLLFDETFTMQKVAGAIAVIIGIAFLAS